MLFEAAKKGVAKNAVELPVYDYRATHFYHLEWNNRGLSQHIGIQRFYRFVSHFQACAVTLFECTVESICKNNDSLIKFVGTTLMCNNPVVNIKTRKGTSKHQKYSHSVIKAPTDFKYINFHFRSIHARSNNRLNIPIQLLN